jgi:phosphotransferase system HPr-like phosphotransfer protein
MKKKFLSVCAMATAAIFAAGSAHAQNVTFNTTGAMADNGSYGNVLNFAASGGSSLQLKVTGWQSNQANSAITSAYVGAYGPGMGVTGLGDYNGSYNYHQIDNAGGYTDFVMLQFSAPVALKSFDLNSFDLPGLSSRDNDMALYAASIPETAWNAKLDLSQYATVPSLWTTLNGTGANGSVSTGMATTSSEWLVGAAFNSGNNDGFKIASITVAPSVVPQPTPPAVPEPASWAMMIVGVGAVGFAMRRRREGATRVATAR